jgi:hypothetical protein
MKKIMIMAVVGLLAIAGQAATVDWKVSYASKGADWSANGATVMAFAGSDYADIVNLVTVSGSETLAADLAAKAIGSGTFINFRGSANNAASISTENAPDSMFWMIFADGSTDAGKSVLWTAATDVKANQYTPPATGTSLTLNASSFANSGTIAAVPEPTSGLLMLVGLAGLALRRRRA